MIDEQVKIHNGLIHKNEMEKYNAYILSDEFKQEYEKVKEMYYPDADPSTYFNDVMMFDHEGNLIKYPEYMKRYVP